MVQIILAVLAGLWRAGEHCRTVGWSSGARFAPRHRSPIRAALRWSKRRGDPTWQGAGLPFDKGRAVVPACVRRLMGSGGRAPSTGSGRRGLLGCRITLGRRKRPKGVISDRFGARCGVGKFVTKAFRMVWRVSTGTGSTFSFAPCVSRRQVMLLYGLPIIFRQNGPKRTTPLGRGQAFSSIKAVPWSQLVYAGL